MEKAKLLLIEKVLVLKALSIFKDTPEYTLTGVAEIMEEIEYEEGVSIFKEGDVGDSMYIIYKGKVRIHKGNKTLIVLDEKEVFGELSLLDSETRSASATAETDCFLFRLEQEPFYDILEARPEVAQGIIRMLCKRLRRQNEKSVLPSV